MASSSVAVGRSAGFLDSARSTGPRSGSGSSPSCGGWVRMRAAVADGESPRNGVRPVPAYVMTQPQANTSAAAVTGASDSAENRSGAM
jgi:hypothetical protein